MFSHLAKLFKTVTGNEDHQAILNAVTQQLNGMDSDMDLIIPEMNLNTSDDNWLDEWGSWFGLTRNYQESDDDFRQRIFDVLLDPTVTIPAIVMIAKRILGQDTLVTVYEPYRDVRYFNISTYSGIGHYEDEDYYRIGVIDVIVNKPITTDLINAIDKVRAAGVSVKFTYEADTVVDMSEKDNPIAYITSESGSAVPEQEQSYAFDVMRPVILSGTQQIYTEPNNSFFDLNLDSSKKPEISLSWDSVSDAQFYLVYCNYKLISQKLSVTHFTDITANFGETRNYQVFANTSNGSVSSILASVSI